MDIPWRKIKESGDCNSMIKEPTTQFIKVRCKCKNEQIIFSKSATIINCLVCGKPLASPTGGKSAVEARILEALN